MITVKQMNYRVPYSLRDLENDLEKEAERDPELASFKNYQDEKITLITSGQVRD